MSFNVTFFVLGLLGLSIVFCSRSRCDYDHFIVSESVKFSSGYNLTRESMKEYFLQRYKAVPDSFDPFVSSLLKAFVDDNPVTAPFFEFLFSQPTMMMIEFDPANPGSWETLFVTNIILFHGAGHNDSMESNPTQGVNYDNSVEIVRSVLIPGYELLNEESVNVIVEALENNDNIAAVMEREAVNNFIKEYEMIIKDLNNEDRENNLKTLLLKARRDSGFKSKHGKYHFAFLIQVPFEVLRSSLKPKGDDFDDLFAKIARAAYSQMIKTTAGDAEAELILSSILPVVYDNVTDEMNYSDKIQMFVDSECNRKQTSNACNHYFELVDPNFENIEGHDFFIDFFQTYLSECMYTRSIDYDSLILYAAIKRIERIYPNFVADCYSQTLQKCIEHINRIPHGTLSKNLAGLTSLSNGLIEIYDFPNFQLTPDILLNNRWFPSFGKIYCFRRYKEIADVNLLSKTTLKIVLGFFLGKLKFKMFDYCCDNLNFELENVKKGLADAIADYLPDCSWESIFEKPFMFSLNMIKEIISSYGFKMNHSFYEKLIIRFAEINARDESEIEYSYKNKIINDLLRAEEFELLYRVLGGEFQLSLNDSVLTNFIDNSEIFNSSNGRFNVMKFILDQCGSHLGRKRFKDAVVLGCKAEIDFFKENYPQMFDDIEVIKEISNNII